MEDNDVLRITMLAAELAPKLRDKPWFVGVSSTADGLVVYASQQPGPDECPADHDGVPIEVRIVRQ